MKRIFTFLTAISVGSLSFGQVVFESDLSTWSGGMPTDWDGTKTTVDAANVVETSTLAQYGTKMAALINTDASSHKRFTTQATTVADGETYEIKIYCSALQGEVRTSYFDLTDNTSGPNGNGYGAYGAYQDLTSFNGVISQYVTLASGCTSAEFILSFRGTDANGIYIDSVSVEAGIPTTNTVSIYDIQYTANANGDSPEAGNFVKTSGVVTAIASAGTNGNGYYIQDDNSPWSAIFVLDGANTPALGDSIEIKGLVKETFNMTQLESVFDFVNHNSSSLTIVPMVISTLNANSEEKYESVLVKVENAISPEGSGANGLWSVDDGSGVVKLDDDCYDNTGVTGDGYDITGVISYSYSEYKINPRNAADIVTVGYASINENELELSVYPNPANENVTISGIENGNVTIYAVNGSVVYNGVVNGTTTVNVNDFTPGFYTVEVVENGLKANYKLMVK